MQRLPRYLKPKVGAYDLGLGTQYGDAAITGIRIVKNKQNLRENEFWVTSGSMAKWHNFCRVRVIYGQRECRLWYAMEDLHYNGPLVVVGMNLSCLTMLTFCSVYL